MQRRFPPALPALTLAVLLAAPAIACDKSGDTKAPADGATTPTVSHRETAPDAVSDDPDAMDDSVSDAMTPSDEDEALRAESDANRASADDEDAEYDEYDDEADEDDFEEDYEDGGA